MTRCDRGTGEWAVALDRRSQFEPSRSVQQRLWIASTMLLIEMQLLHMVYNICNAWRDEAVVYSLLGSHQHQIEPRSRIRWRPMKLPALRCRPFDLRDTAPHHGYQVGLSKPLGQSISRNSSRCRFCIKIQANRTFLLLTRSFLQILRKCTP